ncbi:alpha/beta-hydrolase family protein [Gordonia sp. PKS22-38]|uniref:Alpha/beta-hydrolase family protein n=1 Tax=Gordonia prachuapensis TaxID=3115651 RepID=A0ABU7MWN5_9ACTN|nr:alpha/beta-hydrolase family protein [Gordonia sp. PKS22-38]
MSVDSLRFPRRASVGLPHPLVSCLAAFGAVAALWPSGLPRSSLVSAALVAGCVAVATITGLLLARRRPVPPVGAVAAAAGGIGTTWIAALISGSWQNVLRSDLGAAPVGAEWIVMSALAAMVVFGLIVWLPRTTAVGSAMIAALVAGALPADADDGPAEPPPPPAGVLYGPVDAGSADGRATELVARWVDEGGLDREAVVIAVPTGSGWVDPSAVRGYVDRFGGDVDVLALQYSARPSWQTFVADRSAAGHSAIVLLRAVLDTVAERTPGERPAVHVYGQSLGAVGAEAARVWAVAERPGAVTETVLSGVPGDSVARQSSPDSDRVILANASDPIPRWSLASIWRPARQPHDARIVGRPARQPPWLPVIGFLQTSADLLGSLDGDAGVGHRYGASQTSSLSDAG